MADTSKKDQLNSSPAPPQSSQRITWRERIRHISWQWHIIVMATGVCASLAHNFPYQNSHTEIVFRVTALVFLFLGLSLFIFLCICKAIKRVLYPEDWRLMLMDPAKSLYLGFFANGAAALINASLAVNRDWGTGSDGFLYALWGFWWINSAMACTIAFGLMYVMLGQNYREVSRIGPIWLVPIICLITMSSSGGLFTHSLYPRSHILALITISFSLSMLIIGLSFSMMITTLFLLRLYLHGPLEASSVFSTFSTLTPLGQGGYSLLLNGKNLAELIPAGLLDELYQADTQVTGKIIYSVCFCAAYVLWSLGLAWIAIACFSIIRRASSLPKFSISHWSIIVPNGVYALLSVQMGNVLNSPFFRVFGAVWSCLTLLMWFGTFIRSIPAFVDGSMFTPTAIKAAEVIVVKPEGKPDIPSVEVTCLQVSDDSDVESITETLRHDEHPTLCTHSDTGTHAV